MKFKDLFTKTNDVVLASYPRSGNTWMRILMAYLYFENISINSLVDLQKYIPDEHFKGLNVSEELKINGKYKIIKTHNLNNRKRFKKAIYVYRNPIDVAWSYYNFLKDIKRLENPQLDSFVKNFLNGNLPFGSWEENVKSWMKHENKIVISYEDFAQNTFASIIKINSFLKISIDEEKIAKALNKVTPAIVKKITDDERFYGSNKPNFVNTPNTNISEGKKHFYLNYSDQIKEKIKIYDFKNQRLKLIL